MWTLLCALAICYTYARVYLPFQEQRKDVVQLPDRVLEYFPNKDRSVYSFGLITSAATTVTGELWFTQNFFAAEKLWLKYAFTLIIKAVALYLTPLEVPKGYIALEDKISSHFTNSVETYGRDLFFSSHTALMCLCLINTAYIWVGVTAFLSLTWMLMVNRVHYTIDIFMAPFVAYTCHRLVDDIL